MCACLVFCCSSGRLPTVDNSASSRSHTPTQLKTKQSQRSGRHARNVQYAGSLANKHCFIKNLSIQQPCSGLAAAPTRTNHEGVHKWKCNSKAFKRDATYFQSACQRAGTFSQTKLVGTSSHMMNRVVNFTRCMSNRCVASTPFYSGELAEVDCLVVELHILLLTGGLFAGFFGDAMGSCQTL